MAAIAILGGTGPEGLGLAIRFAAAGEEIIVGSRDATRAAEAAARVAAAVPGGRVRSAINLEAAQAADLVLLALAHAGAEPFVTEHAGALAGKIVVDVMVPLRFEAGVCRAVPVADGSVGQMIARLAPRARVVSAFKNLSAEHLLEIGRALEGDVLLCGDDAGAKETVAALAARLRDLRPVDAGPLSGAAGLEALTVLLLNVNRRYRAVTSVKIVGID